MAWNEPGGGKRDPWGGRGGQDGPPDLDEVARKMRDRMNNIFGGGKSGGRGGSSISFGMILIVALALFGVALGRFGLRIGFGGFFDGFLFGGRRFFYVGGVGVVRCRFV